MDPGVRSSQRRRGSSASNEAPPNLPLEGRSKSGERSETDFGRGADASGWLPPPEVRFASLRDLRPPLKGEVALCAQMGGVLARLAAALLAAMLAAPATAAPINNPVAEFTGLDKITGRTITFDVKIDETVQFGALQVTPRVCHTRPPTEPAQTTAFVEVDEITLANKIQRLFTGWMFAASPGLHAVEHPVYDVWLVDCKLKMGEEEKPVEAAPLPETELPSANDAPED
jgi:hypothetical protein